jgi:hypothetical protein
MLLVLTARARRAGEGGLFEQVLEPIITAVSIAGSLPFLALGKAVPVDGCLQTGQLYDEHKAFPPLLPRAA